ncbi:MAG: thioredoxin, partial [Candidatus Marinimicrobia bacterium]|nr:thioredoxin [Candidatus Neomarinimicrobiota bacterium]
VWCGPCKAIAPTIEEIADDYTGKVKVGKLNVDQNQNTAMQYGVRSIPTLLIMKSGEVVSQIVGAVPKENITKALDEIL